MPTPVISMQIYIACTNGLATCGWDGQRLVAALGVRLLVLIFSCWFPNVWVYRGNNTGRKDWKPRPCVRACERPAVTPASAALPEMNDALCCLHR